MNCGIKALLDGVYFVYDRKVFCLSVNGDRGCCTQWFEGRDQVIHSGCGVSKYNLFYPIFPVGWQMILAQNILKLHSLRIPKAHPILVKFKKIFIKQCLHINWKGFSEKAKKRTFDIDVVSAVCGHTPRFTPPLPPATLQQTEDEWDL